MDIEKQIRGKLDEIVWESLMEDFNEMFENNFYRIKEIMSHLRRETRALNNAFGKLMKERSQRHQDLS